MSWAGRVAAGEVVLRPLAYTQARAITRVATRSCAATWIELAHHTTAAQLEKTARGVRRALSPDPEPAPERASLTWGYDTDGWLRGSFLLHPDDAPASWNASNTPPAPSRPTARPAALRSKTPSRPRMRSQPRQDQPRRRRRRRILPRKNLGHPRSNAGQG